MAIASTFVRSSPRSHFRDPPRCPRPNRAARCEFGRKPPCPRNRSGAASRLRARIDNPLDFREPARRRAPKITMRIRARARRDFSGDGRAGGSASVTAGRGVVGLRIAPDGTIERVSAQGESPASGHEPAPRRALFLGEAGAAPRGSSTRRRAGRARRGRRRGGAA